jgi:hypothetical protein
MLVIPQLVYQFTQLPNAPERIFSTIENAIKNFIRDGKRAKINLNQLCQDYCKGGLRLTSVREFCDSLKITWVQRIAPNDNNIHLSKWANVINYFLRKWDADLIWKGNLNSTDVKFFRVENEFLKHVLEAWCKVHFTPMEDLSDLEQCRAQIIWFNSHIRVNRQPIFYRQWFEKNVLYVNDLLDESGEMRNLEYFQHQLHIQTHFLQYYGLRSAIPWHFDHSHLTGENVEDIVSNDFHRIIFLRCSSHYSKMVPPRPFHSRWLDIFNTEDIIDSEPFKN